MARSYGTKELWLTELRADGLAFRAAAGEAGAEAGVPSCPGWTVADLVHHVGSIYRYVNAHAGRGVITPPDRRLQAVQGEPPAADVFGWFDEQFHAILDTLDTLAEDAPAWNWAPAPKRAAFWQRRMAHETTIHRWDAQMATGRAEPIVPRLAADGIAEILDTFVPSGHCARQGEHVGLVALDAIDVEQSWLVRLRAEGIALLDTETIFDDDEHRPTAVARGLASDLMLALWGRVGLDVLDLTGDERAIEALRIA